MAEPATAAPEPTPAPATRGEVKWTEVLIVVGVCAVMVTVAFIVLGKLYYADKLRGLIASDPRVTDIEAVLDERAWARMWDVFFPSFITFVVIGSISIAGAVLYPRYVAHGLAALFGIGYLAGAMKAGFAAAPLLVIVVQLAFAAMLGGLAWLSWHKRDRAAWAFLAALCLVLAILHLFGAPRIRDALEMSRLWYALVIPMLFVSTCVALYRVRHDVT